MEERTQPGQSGRVGAVDEAQDGPEYTMALAEIEGSDLPALSELLSRRRARGHRRLHTRCEHPGTRRSLARDLQRSGLVHWQIYRARGSANGARSAILHAIVHDCLAQRVNRLVVELGDEGRNSRDRRQIARALDEAGADLHCSLEPPWAHPALQAADFGAWMYVAGGEWRRSIAAMIVNICEIRIGPQVRD